MDEGFNNREYNKCSVISRSIQLNQTEEFRVNIEIKSEFNKTKLKFQDRTLICLWQVQLTLCKKTNGKKRLGD